MSGFEVAGIVLGSFPLIISALENYHEVAEVWGTFWNFRREYEHWKHQLRVCHLAFEQNLEEFLLPLVVEDDELAALLADPGGERWQDPELERRLKERLPKSYDLYLETMARIERVMMEVKKRLCESDAHFQRTVVGDSDSTNLPQDGLLTRISQLSINESKAAIKSQTNRIRISLRQAKRDKLFQDLSDCNTELRSLLDTSDRIAALRQARETNKKNKAITAAGKALWQFWRHADRLYSLITRRFTCECRKFHLANLLLQHRTSAKVDFRVLFVFASLRGNAGEGDGGGGWSWTCQETQIDLLEKPKPSPARAPAVRFASAPAAVASSCSWPIAVLSATAAPLTPASSLVSSNMSGSRTPSPTPSCPSPTASMVPSKSSFRKSWMEKFKKGHKKGSSVTLVQFSTTTCPSPVQSPPTTTLAVLPSRTPSTETAPAAIPTAVAAAPAAIVPIIVTPTLTPSNSDVHEDDFATIDIINLCETMAKLPKGKSTAPACLTDDEENTHFVINPVSDRVSSPTAVRDTVSLEAILLGNKPAARRPKSKRPDIPLPSLTRRERYFIALTLASSYLQLHSSPWISPRWNKREILFLRDPKCPGGVALGQPYISRDFLESGGSAATNGCDSECAPLPTTSRDDHSLASLGIMLLELCFGVAVEEHELRRGQFAGFGTRRKKEKKPWKGEDQAADESEDDGTDNQAGEDESEDEIDPEARHLLDMATALQWLRRAPEEAGPDFAEACEWCLRSIPGSGENGGKLDKWREEMFLKVVTPLKYCYDQLVTVRC